MCDNNISSNREYQQRDRSYEKKKKKRNENPGASKYKSWNKRNH